MQKKISWIGLALFWGCVLQVSAQNDKQGGTYKRWFIGSSFLMLGNFDKVNSPEYVQLNVGYRITSSDAVSFELKRSIYAWPLGIPWGKSFDAPGENYPGHARILAPTFAYQHFWWKGVYTAVHALNAFEKYKDQADKKIGNGYTLYLTYRVGYQLNFFNNRFFFEPSIGLTHWPIRNGVPASFEVIENKWPKYFGWEPGLHFGYNF